MQEMIYQWKPGARMKVAAQVVGQALETLEGAFGGVTPAAVVQDAKPDAAPLHPCFEWDDSLAAEKHRDWQARYLLRSIVVVMKRDEDSEEGEQPRTIRAFIPVIADGEEAKSYRPINVVMADPCLKAQALQAARAELASFRRKYSDLEELGEVLVAIDKALLVAA